MKPSPRPLNVVCTNCGQDWEKHGAKPTEAKCVELLKVALASAKRRQPISLTGTGTTIWPNSNFGPPQA